MSLVSHEVSGPSVGDWHSTPELPLEYAPIFVWPPRPLAAVRYLLSRDFLSHYVPYVVLAIVTWLFLQPALDRCTALEVGWLVQVYARDLTFMVLIGSGLHLFLYTFRRQGTAQKFDSRDLSRSSSRFALNNQVWDNIFWTCASGVTIWALYEAGMIWAYANQWLPSITFSENPIWFLSLFVLIPIWYDIHFYFVHRLLHWKPLYRIAHSVHHRNVNMGPWSGISMHPIEHLLLFSTVLIHLVVPSHPIHVLVHLYYTCLGPLPGHSGYAHLRVNGKDVVALTDFFHQLHHRHFNCNYGARLIPFDRWLGTEHDGTEASLKRIRSRSPG